MMFSSTETTNTSFLSLSSLSFPNHPIQSNAAFVRLSPCDHKVSSLCIGIFFERENTPGVWNKSIKCSICETPVDSLLTIEEKPKKYITNNLWWVRTPHTEPILTERVIDYDAREFGSRLALLKLVGQRRRLLDYLNSTDTKRYQALIRFTNNKHLIRARGKEGEEQSEKTKVLPPDVK